MLVVNFGELDGWSAKTIDLASHANKPLLLLQIDQRASAAAAQAADWLEANRIAVLYVAGPREAVRPGATRAAMRFLADLVGFLTGAAREHNDRNRTCGNRDGRR